MIKYIADHNHTFQSFDTVDTAILIENNSHELIHVSNSVCEIFDIPLLPKDLIGTSILHLFKANELLFDDDSFKVVNKNIQIDSFINEESIEEHIHLKNHQSFSLEISPIYNLTKEISGRVWLFKHKKQNSTAPLIQKEDFELKDLKAKFIAMVSHEFRTPLAAISSSMEIIDIIEQKQNNSSSSKISEHLSKANLHLSRLTELLDEVLLLNDIENGNLVLSKTEFELKDLILEIKKEFAYCDFDCNMEFNHINGKIFADRRLIKTSLQNIFSNAIKFSENSKLINIHTEETTAELMLSIKDFGMGIPLKDQQHIFKSFYRASNVSNIPGAGLGLLIVKHILRLHEAQIRFFSREGFGTEFVIVSPKI